MSIEEYAISYNDIRFIEYDFIKKWQTFPLCSAATKKEIKQYYSSNYKADRQTSNARHEWASPTPHRLPPSNATAPKSPTQLRILSMQLFA